MPDSREQVLQSHATRLAALAIERNLAEEALRTSEAKFRGLFEGVIEGVYQSTRDGRLVSVNSAFVEDARATARPRRCTRCRAR